jgi:hypothetical protein
MCDYTTEAAASLAQMYNNDTLGDCVVAAIEHIVGVFTGNADGGTPFEYTQDQTLATYSGACGYVPGYPATDNGCDIQQTLGYWQSGGVPNPSNHKIVGWLAVNPADATEMQTALWLFENLIFGIALPDAWISPFPSSSGFVWDVAGAPDPYNGHCFPGVAYDATGITISTWAMLGKITYAAIAEYAAASAQGELYTAISQDQLNIASGLAPNGFDWVQLTADFQALGSVVTPPTPAPTPSPTPTPPVPAALFEQLQLDLMKMLANIEANGQKIVVDLEAILAAVSATK